MFTFYFHIIYYQLVLFSLVVTLAIFRQLRMFILPKRLKAFYCIYSCIFFNVTNYDI